MKQNNTLIIVIIFIVSGLFYNISQAYNRISYTLHITEELNHIKILNKDLDLLIKNINHPNYDKINTLVLEIGRAHV